MESKLGRKKLEIIRNERELLQKAALSSMESFQIIDDQLATINFSPTKILWNKPIIVGATILDLAKSFMFQFHETDLNLELHYNAPDSFIYAIKNDDVYRDLEKIKAEFDFSNYNEDHFLFQSFVRGAVSTPVRTINYPREQSASYSDDRVSSTQSAKTIDLVTPGLIQSTHPNPACYAPKKTKLQFREF